MYLARVDGKIGDPNARKYFYHTDHLGSVKIVTNGDGVKVWEADYYSFGRQFARNKVDPTFEEDDLGFTGKGYDADIGLYYFNARWYDPDLGRFISEDPAADPNNLNLYTYCGNNPLTRVDPTGEFWWIIAAFLWNWGDKASKFADKYAEPGHWMDAFLYGLFGAPTFTFGTNIYIGNDGSFSFKPPSMSGWDGKISFPGGSTYESYFGFEFFPLYDGVGGAEVDNSDFQEYQTALEYLSSELASLQNQLNSTASPEVQQQIQQQIMVYAQLILRIKNQIGFIWPTTGVITSPYNPGRPEFTTKEGKKVPAGHRAIDIANVVGTPIVAMQSGTVTRMRETVGSGIQIEIDYGNGFKSVYHHLSGYAPNIEVGRTVRQGQVVALMGNTGTYTTGPHLHFELWLNGQRVNPADYLPKWK